MCRTPAARIPSPVSEERRSRWPRGISRRTAGKPLCELGASARPIEAAFRSAFEGIRRALVDRVAEERASGYRRVKIKIKHGLDREPVETIPQSARRHSADGRRQRGLHDGRCRQSSGPRWLWIDDDRAAPRLRRPGAARAVAEAVADTNLPGRIDSQSSDRHRRARSRILPDHQHQARASRWIRGVARSSRHRDLQAGSPVAWRMPRPASGARTMHLSTLPGFTLPGVSRRASVLRARSVEKRSTTTRRNDSVPAAASVSFRRPIASSARFKRRGSTRDLSAHGRVDWSARKWFSRKPAVPPCRSCSVCVDAIC